MTARRGTALAVGIVAVFGLTTLSVVDARDPVDAKVTRSFGSAVAKKAAAGATIAPLRCRKRALNTYECLATTPGSATPRTYRLLLADDGCWTATDQSEQTPVTVPAEMQGCLAE